jgi:type 1 glutamine amidotransferase
MNTLSRRDWLLASGAALLGVSALPAAARPAGKKVLFFTKSAGFQHSVINRQGGDTSHAEKILAEIGKAHGFDVTCSKDGTLFEPDQIGEWDAFAFYTTGDLTQAGTDGTKPMSPKGKEALLGAVSDGKGFAGMHCATDTFHSKGDDVDPYIRMIGGEFISHGPQHVARLITSDTGFPGAGGFGPEFEINDEWYAQKNLATDLHVVIYHVTKGMQSGPARDYERPNFPQTWTRKHGKGRVFYTSMGHREDVWTNPKYQGLLLGGLSVITGLADADFEPNVSKVTPGYQQTKV